LCDIRADLSDDTGDLIAKDGGERRYIVRRKQKIGVTQPGRLHLDESFASNGRSHVNILKVEATTGRVNY
jgi:hypothetical protein